ncbi:LCP family protein, partial [Ruminococcaceae bacterium OttesenSCG-928-L11]|nr:LCP family protein [Ruminococcaceae bacterium OttesenSCG-928-L11]
QMNGKPFFGPGPGREEFLRRLKYFLLTFSGCFLLFSMMYLGFMTVFHPDAYTAATTAQPEEDAYRPEEEDAMTVLFIGASDADTAGVFLVVRFDPAGGRVPVAELPGDMLVDNNGRQESIGEVYRYGGASYTRDCLARQLGIAIDRYVKMQKAAFIEAADAVGTYEYELESDVTVRSGGAQLQMKAGRQLLDGQRTTAILETSGQEMGAGRMAVSIINQRIDIALTTVVDKLFERIINMVDSDIIGPDYHLRKDAAAHLAEQGGEPAYLIPVSGERDGEGFHMSDTAVARLRREFG